MSFSPRVMDLGGHAPPTMSEIALTHTHTHAGARSESSVGWIGLFSPSLTDTKGLGALSFLDLVGPPHKRCGC